MDPVSLAALLLVVHAGATAYLFGLVWFVQRVHYPLFARVGAGAFGTYQRGHLERIGAVVGPPMLVEGATGLALWFFPAAGVGRGLVGLGVLLLAVIWTSTLLLQIPRHRELSRGFDAAAHRRLVATNWIRTGAWSLRALLVAGMVLMAIRRGAG